MLQNATPLKKSAPGPPNSSDEHVSTSATENASLQTLFKCPTPAIVFGNATKPSRFAHFWQGAQSLAPATRNDIWTLKSGPSMCFSHFDFEMCFAPQRRAPFRHHNFQKCSEPVSFYTFDFEMCFAPQRVHFFDIATSKSAPRTVCFLHFDLEMCFAPQRRTLFGHLNFQKWSENGFFIFWLGNVLRATTACNFSSLIWPHGSAPAALARLLFDPGATNHWKNTVFGGFSTFLRACIFFPLTLSLLWSSFFSSLTLPTSAFPSLYTVGSLTSKLPSIIYLTIFSCSCWLCRFICIFVSGSGSDHYEFIWQKLSIIKF